MAQVPGGWLGGASLDPTPSALALPNADGELGAGRRTRAEDVCSENACRELLMKLFHNLIPHSEKRGQTPHNPWLRFSKGSWVNSLAPHLLPPNQAGRNRGGLMGPPGGCPSHQDLIANPNLSILQISRRKRSVGTSWWTSG